MSGVRQPFSRVVAAGIAVAVLAAGAPHVPLSAQSAQTPLPQQNPTRPLTFSAATTIVPVDVRVEDDKGQPVTDLKQEDFVVFEDGVRQSVKLFVPYTLTADPEAARLPLPVYREGETAAAPSNRRVFLLLLGRGRLDAVSHGVQAAIKFVRDEINPQDAVAVMAWDRATEFSVDHNRIVRLLERFGAKDEAIEQDLKEWFSGLRAQYGSKIIPPFIQDMIDTIFDGGVAVTAAAVPELDRVDREFAADDRALGRGRTLDDFASSVSRTGQDLPSLYAGIEYLRTIEGEKHLIFMTENGVSLPSLEDDHNVAARASDARVAIHTIQTGGSAAYDPRTMESAPAWAISTLRNFALLSGGEASYFSAADKAFATINRVTATGYLLGYSPTHAEPDGHFRQIDVRVVRKGLTINCRRGYFATGAAALSSRDIESYTAIAIAAAAAEPIKDLRLRASVADTGHGTARGIDVQLGVDAAQVVPTVQNGIEVIPFEVAVFCNDRDSRSLTQVYWRTVTLRLTLEEFQQARAGDLLFKVSVPVDVQPRIVKVVVRDPATGLVGAVFARDYRDR